MHACTHVERPAARVSRPHPRTVHTHLSPVSLLWCSIANWTPKIDEQGVNALMVRAFDAWSAYGRLRFTRAFQPSEADITIAFGRGNHGDW